MLPPTDPVGPATRVGLRPDAPLLRRDAVTLQVGLEPRALLTDGAAVRRLLADLRDGGVDPRSAPGDPAAARALHRLTSAGLLVPIAAAPPHVSATAALGAAAWAGPDAPDRLGARTRLRLALRGDARERDALTRALEGSGVAPGGEPEAEAPAAGGPEEPTGPRPALVVLRYRGEPRREDVDPLVRDGWPHLLTWWRGGVPRVGPLVVPGATACLRCVDAHAAEADPRLPLLLDQAAGVTHLETARDPVLAAAATALTAREVLRFAEGDRPSTWSTVVTLGPRDLPVAAGWRQHPHCGCGWDLLGAVG